MIKVDIDGPYRSKRKSMLSRLATFFAYALICLLVLCVAWIAFIWMLDIYLGSMQEPPIDIKNYSLNSRT